MPSFLPPTLPEKFPQPPPASRTFAMVDMDEMEVFSKRFLGMSIRFTEKRAETWALIKKTSDKHPSCTQEEYELLGRPFAAYGTFDCVNVNKPNQKAVMRVFMQIPHYGAWLQNTQEKAKQASDQLTYPAFSEFEAYKQLTEGNCRSAPTLLNYKIDKQGMNGFVPGGFAVYVLLAVVPGIRLGPGFWDFDADERQRIREAFKISWRDCARNGIVGTETKLESLVWDRDHDKLYITEFHNCRPAEPKEIWGDIKWIAWGMAKPPQGYRWYLEKEIHPDTSDWVF